MAKHVYITDVTGGNDEWRVKVIVCSKSNVYKSDKGKRVQKMLLVDAQGNKAEGVLWDGSVDTLRSTLAPFSTYIIGGTQVVKINPGSRYATPGITIQWSMSTTTYIRLVTDEAEKLPYPAVEALPFDQMRLLANSGMLIDIMAVVRDVKEVKLFDVKGRPRPIRECSVMNEEFMPFTVSLWGDLAETQGEELFALRKKLPNTLQGFQAYHIFRFHFDKPALFICKLGTEDPTGSSVARMDNEEF